MMVLQVGPRRANRRDLPIRAIQDGPHLSLSLHRLAYRSSVTAPAARRPPALTCRPAQRAFTLTVLITYRNAICRHRLAACGGAHRDRSGGRRRARYPQVLRTNNPAACEIAHDQARANHRRRCPARGTWRCWGTGNDGPVSTATASSVLNAAGTIG